ncbi:hypothetical protein CWATWH8502_1488 [Crocosphaera watsonii WH 8502]|uniref:Uncharacterized protein n=4 Tax=Crocosphaera watsonii TaxID=263511 RepID=T2K0D9_CROWT|nr:hypothetical protein CWATWH0003_0884 [Crocosphaera watsonii WH 0003]CCQ51756.1 hypothetical protein CWATWH8502_1488 [Crocosphaera watsonii WH 8502]CCQ54291.1 hypothetical protein CWATWH0005_2886 [Crocosphaera watsonii WH 0005]CCQ70856.1 hypothetical protein CWATWH0402_350 [Crocosphaera watsonii WH 0402]
MLNKVACWVVANFGKQMGAGGSLVPCVMEKVVEGDAVLVFS